MQQLLVGRRIWPVPFALLLFDLVAPIVGTAATLVTAIAFARMRQPHAVVRALFLLSGVMLMLLIFGFVGQAGEPVQ